jgi:hypothetical protein
LNAKSSPVKINKNNAYYNKGRRGKRGRKKKTDTEKGEETELGKQMKKDRAERNQNFVR